MNHSFEKLENDFPSIFGTWRIVREIGRGSFGEVYEVRRESLGLEETAAMKHISYPRDQYDLQRICSDLGTTDEAAVRDMVFQTVQEIRREYELMQKFSGETHIVSCKDFQAVQKKDMPGYDIFIRMELLTPVSDLILAGQMNREETVRMGADICGALELLESEKVIHRDIKPENLFVNERGDYKLGDFGAARNMSEAGASMSVKGTPAYMAPEVALQKEVGSWTDIYSLGLVLYRLANYNQPPFVEGTQSVSTVIREKASTRRIAGEALPPPADAGEQLAPVILKACAAKPEDRYQTAEEFRKALLEACPEYAKPRIGTERKREAGIPRVPAGIRTSVMTEEEKADLERQEAEKRAREAEEARKRSRQAEEARGKKRKKTVIIIAACVAAVAVIAVTGLLISKNAEKKSLYQKGQKLLEEGEFDQAEKIFTDLGSFSDAAIKAEEVRNAEQLHTGKEKLDGGALEDAEVIFTELIDKDPEARGLLEETQRQKTQRDLRTEADAQYDKGLSKQEENTPEGREAALTAYNNAIQQYSKLAEKDDTVNERITDCENRILYIQAENDLAEGEFDGARSKFTALSEIPFGDAEDRLAEVDREEKLADARKKFDAQQYQDAIDAYSDPILAGDPRAAEGMAEAKQYQDYGNAESLLKKKKYDEAAEAFAELGDFSDASQAKEYALAWQALKEKRYTDAKNAFLALEDYRDAEAQAQAAANKETEQDKQKALREEADAQYDKGLSKQEENTPEGREAALTAYNNAKQKYSSLTERDDTLNDRITDCENRILYIQAENDLAEGEFDGARSKFTALSEIPFGDAEDRLAEVDREEKLADARKKFDAQQYQDAIDAYSDPILAGDPRAAEGKTEAKLHQDYGNAESLLKKKKYDEAAEAFAELGDFSDASQAKEYALAWQALKEKRYTDAKNAFLALEDYRDAEAQAQEAAKLESWQDLYEEAGQFYSAQQYDQAKTRYDKILNFENAKELADICGKYISLAQAKEYMDNANYSGAYSILKNLHFENSDELAEECLFGDFCKDAASRHGLPGVILKSCYRYIYNQPRVKENLKIWAKTATPDKLDGAQIAIAFATAPQFTSIPMSNTQRVRVLYDTLLNRAGTPEDEYTKKHGVYQDAQICVEYLDIGMTIMPVLKHIVGTEEFKKLCANDGLQPGEIELTEVQDQDYVITRFVADCYPACFGYERKVDRSGLKTFTSECLIKKRTLEDVMALIATSAEANKAYPGDEAFVRMLYRFMLGREATRDDVKLQTGELAKGVKRFELAQRIANAAECADYLDRYPLTAEQYQTLRSKAGRYNQALRRMEEGKYEKARELFLSLGDYKDSAEKAEACLGK